MHHSSRFSRWQATRFTTRGLRVKSQRRAREHLYRHIVVLTGLTSADCHPLLLGFDLALLHQATLTLLHVAPSPAPDRIASGLDAIDLLHAAAEQLPAARATAISSESARLRMLKFLKDTVPPRQLAAVSWRAEYRAGDVSPTVVSYVNESAADLVVLPQAPSGWLPLASLLVWTVERRTSANVIAIRSRASSRSSGSQR
jgi:hypothetical protein